eukprot:UN25309
MSKTKFNPDYTTYPSAEYFDVYSPPIQSRYGEVFWTMMEAVPLPDNIVKRFSNKTMVVVGYETDQVRKTDKGDVPWPIYYAYNHHYEAYLNGAASTLEKREIDWDDDLDLGKNHGYPQEWFVVEKEGAYVPDNGHPTSQFFSEGNGGEFRKSYHGYPHGFGQFIFSPEEFRIQPMQIDTHNRNYNGTGFKPDILPKRSGAPPDAKYSGILECPCSDRRDIKWGPTYATQSTSKCDASVANETSCFAAAQSSVGLDPKKIVKNITVNSGDYPAGCYVVNNNNAISVYWNKNSKSAAQCGQGADYFTAQGTSLVDIDIL